MQFFHLRVSCGNGFDFFEDRVKHCDVRSIDLADKGGSGGEVRWSFGELVCAC